MTYLQLMLKCLEFFKSQKEKFDSYGFYYYWLANEEEDIDSYYKSKAKKALMYLLLLETKNSGNVNIPLLNILERELSYFDVSLCKTIETAEQNTISSISEDPYMFDQMCLLELGELTEEEQKEIINELFSEFKKQIPNNWETQQYESAIHTVMEMVSQIIPELFFTKSGYKYIDKEYQIEDEELRKKCYEYLKDNIRYYNSERIYKVDENVYSNLYENEDEEELDDLDDEFEYDEELDDYEDDEDLDDDNLFLDEDEIRGQIDIYGEDIDNYDILHYSVTLLIVMLRFIKNKQYDKLEILIELDETMTNFYDGHNFNYDKTVIEALYQPKTMGQDFHKEITIPAKSDIYLDFFLSNNEFTQQYNTQQLSLIIAHCFDLFDSEPLKTMFKNIDMINNVFSTTDLDNQEENIKRLVKIKNTNNHE